MTALRPGDRQCERDPGGHHFASYQPDDYILDQIQRIGSNIIYASYEAGSNGAVSANADFVKLADVDAVRMDNLGSAAFVAATGVMNNYDRMRIAEGEEEDA